MDKEGGDHCSLLPGENIDVNNFTATDMKHNLKFVLAVIENKQKIICVTVRANDSQLGCNWAHTE